MNILFRMEKGIAVCLFSSFFELFFYGIFIFFVDNSQNLHIVTMISSVLFFFPNLYSAQKK